MRKFHQDDVAGMVAVAIVDELEVVKVDQQKGNISTTSLRACQSGVEAGLVHARRRLPWSILFRISCRHIRAPPRFRRHLTTSSARKEIG